MFSIYRLFLFLKESKGDRSLWFIIYFTIILASLLLHQGGSIDLERAPQWAFRAFAFAGLLLFSILDSKRIQSVIGKINFLGVLPIALILLLINSNIVSIRPSETFEETMNILAYASLAFLCFTYIDSLKRLRQFLEILMVAGFLIAFHGLFIFYGALWSRGETTPLSSLFYWHNPCAGFLLLVWPTMLAQYYTSRKGWHTFLILYIFYFTFTAFGLTLSRGGWLSGFFPFLLIPFVLSRKRLMVSWRPLALIGLYFLSAIPFVLKYRGRFFQPIIDRWNQMRPDDYSVVGRLEFWDISWRVFLKHPFMGIGFNTFGYYYVHYQTNPQYFTKDPHNFYLRFLAEGGIIGGIVVISILAIVIKLIIKTLSTPPGKMLTVYRVGLLAGIIAELLHMGLDFDWTFPILPMLLICQIAILSRTFTYPKDEQELTIEQWEPEKTAVEAKTKIRGIDKSGGGWFINRLWIWQVLAVFLFLVNILGYTSMSLYEKGDKVIKNQMVLAQERVEGGMSQTEREMFRRSTQESGVYDPRLMEAQSEIIQEGKIYWERSLTYNPWNWYALKELLNLHYQQVLNLGWSWSPEELDSNIIEGLGYGYRLLKITPHRAATHYYIGQFEILTARIRQDNELAQSGLGKLLHSIELDPLNIPKYYLGIAKYYFYEGLHDEALKYLETLEEIYVPLYDTGDIDFGALKGKSLARLDWIEITETIREAWGYKADILYGLDRREEALISLYNGFNTPLGGGEMMEQHYDLAMLQFPYALRITEISAELEDWSTVKLRGSQALDTLNKRPTLSENEQTAMINLKDLISQANSHLGIDDDFIDPEKVSPDGMDESESQ